VSGLNVFRYTNSASDVIFGGITYTTGQSLSRSNPEFSKESSHQQLTINSVISNPVAMLYSAGPSWESIWVTIRRAHVGDTQTVIIWQGRIKSVNFHLSNGEVEIICDPITVVSGKSGCRQNCGPQCCKQLYSTRCGVIESIYTDYATVTAIDSTATVITSATFGGRASGFYKLGELYVLPLLARMQIIAHIGNNITIRRPVVGLVNGMSVRVIAGCDHVWKLSTGASGDCIAKFNNAINFGGQPFTPIKNPYEVGLEG
jgi:uncharacterized phage protein (TIGR02218 family)